MNKNIFGSMIAPLAAIITIACFWGGVWKICNSEPKPAVITEPLMDTCDMLKDATTMPVRESLSTNGTYPLLNLNECDSEGTCVVQEDMFGCGAITQKLDINNDKKPDLAITYYPKFINKDTGVHRLSDEKGHRVVFVTVNVEVIR